MSMYKGKKVRITVKGPKTVNIIDEDGVVTTGVPSSEVTENKPPAVEKTTSAPLKEEKKPYFKKKD